MKRDKLEDTSLEVTKETLSKFKKVMQSKKGWEVLLLSRINYMTQRKLYFTIETLTKVQDDEV